MVDVFISYSRDNKDRVAEIARAVSAAGYDVWWDAELPPHRSYGDVITEKISSARAAIVVWSHTSAQSEWVRAEADVARNQKKLIQTAIDDVMPPLPFNQIQFADLSDWHGQADHSGWRKVLLSLEELCQRAPVAAIPPAVSPLPPVPDTVPAREARASPMPWILIAVAVVAVAAAGWQMMRQRAAIPGEGQAPLAVTDDSGGSALDGAAATANSESFVLAAVINDPDGFTNIRSRPAASAPVVAKVLDGEKFLTYRQSGPWWRVRTRDGTTGFMYRKLMRVLDGPAPDPAPATAMPTGTRQGYLIADSSTRMLTEADVAGWSRSDLRLARNEIFARHGRRFSDAGLRDYFSQFAWYRPTADEVSLSPVERANVELLQAVENAQ